MIFVALGAGCDRPPPTPAERSANALTIPQLAGTWAWYGVENCWAHGNSIRFQPEKPPLFKITVNVYNTTAFDVPDVEIVRKVVKRHPVFIVRYQLQSRRYEEHYQPLDANTLKPLQSLVEGRPQKLSSIETPGRVLIRCPNP